MQFILGILIMGAGFLMVVKSEWLINNVGRIGFFEQYLGTEGGTRLGYKLMGILVLFIGMLVMTGMIGGFLNWVFSPVTRYNLK